MTSLSELADELRADGVGSHVALGFAVRSFGGWFLRTGGDENAIFDLASLTKPMFAAACVRAGISPETKLGAMLPEIRGLPIANATVLHLLSHRSGLDAHVPLYLTCTNERIAMRDAEKHEMPPVSISRERAVIEAAKSTRADLEWPIPQQGFAPLYSDLGFILLGEAAARIYGTVDAGALIEREVTSLLGLQRELGTVRSLKSFTDKTLADRTQFVPTETVGWRGGEICGEVHDENAWALTGLGGSGHAGMFGTVEAVLRFAVHVVEARQDYGWLLQPRHGATLRAGFDGKSLDGSSAGTRMSKSAVGHLGFTGTSFWIDLDQGVVVSLLTNRVRPTRENQKIKEVRPRVHDALFGLALEAARASYRLR